MAPCAHSLCDRSWAVVVRRPRHKQRFGHAFLAPVGTRAWAREQAERRVVTEHVARVDSQAVFGAEVGHIHTGPLAPP